MRVHLVSLPHTQTTSDFVSCAYTMKLVKFCKMMKPLGYEVVLYSGEDNEADCFEHVPVVTKDQQIEWFGEPDPQAYYPITWDPQDQHWLCMNRRVVEEVRSRREGREDLVLLIAGNCQQQIAEGLPDMLSVEWGVGYEGIFSNHCAFESHAWRHFVYGKRGMNDGRWYDATIPNFFDTDDFHVGPKPRDDYLLFMGRVVTRKGPEVAAQIAERAGMRLVIAGQGARTTGPGLIKSREVTIRGDHVEYVGAVGPERRAELMARATATVVPTYYIEPFGGVAVESMLAGTPVVASDWGAFTETVVPGVSGERFHTLQGGADAVERVRGLDPEAIRRFAAERYSLEAVGPQFDTWFKRLLGLWGRGWDA